MILLSRSADKHRERRWHLAISSFVGGVGLFFCAVFYNSTLLTMAALTIATMGVFSSLPVFWSLPTAFLKGSAAAAGIALINSFGNISGFIGNYFIGWLKDLTQSTNVGMYILSAFLFTGGLLTLTLPARTVNK